MHQELVSIEVWTVIAQWCNLLILFLLVKKFLFKPVQNILNKRQAEIDTMYTSASEANKTATELKENYETHLLKAKDEAVEIISSANQKAQAQSENIIREAHEEAARITEKAASDIEQERKKALNEVKDEISDIAIDIASKVVEKEISASDHERLIEEFINNVGDAV